jgi:hypothetical protein
MQMVTALLSSQAMISYTRKRAVSAKPLLRFYLSRLEIPVPPGPVTSISICLTSEEKPELNPSRFPNVDLFSAGINALNGVLVARNPSHNRGYALVGLLIMAFFGGIGGGVTRDVLSMKCLRRSRAQVISSSAF